jgi:hypothetical protein
MPSSDACALAKGSGFGLKYVASSWPFAAMLLMAMM